MEIEAAIFLIRIQFDRITKFYGVRVLKLQSSHPVRALIKPSFTEPMATILIDGIRSMQSIHSLNQRQAEEAGVMATRR
jgi:hypothetical protein